MRLQEIERLLQDAQGLCLKSANRYFHWYNKERAKSALYNIEEAYLSSEDKAEFTDINSIYYKQKFSPYQNRQEALSSIATLLDDLRERDEMERAENAEFQRSMDLHEANLNSENPFLSIEAKLGQAALSYNRHLNPKTSLISEMNMDWKELGREYDLIEALATDITIHRRKILDMIAGIQQNPEHSRQITLALLAITFLFFAGVIWPLSFLPQIEGAQPNPTFAAFIPTLQSFKGLMLAIVSVCFIAIPAIFMRMNESLKYSMSTIKELREWSELSKYSEYFGYKKENDEFRSLLKKLHE